jgi:Cu-Zn family superoxide dismutase
MAPVIALKKSSGIDFALQILREPMPRSHGINQSCYQPQRGKPMKYMALLSVALLLCGTTAYAQRDVESEPVKVEMINAQGEKIGSATLTPDPKGVKVSIQVSKLPPGTHGFHIHAVGICDPPDFKTADGHFNPFKKEHGLQNPGGPHGGDLPNLVVGPDGTATTEAVAPGLRFTDGPESIFPPGDTALVIHANADDERTDPDGKAGDRIACGVISKPKTKTSPG